MSVQIEKDIPIPGSRSVWPFSKMEIGDSFLAPSSLKKSYAAVLAAGANRACAPKRFVSRKTSEGYRIWRIA